MKSMVATTEGTAQLARQHSEKQQLPQSAYRTLGRTGLTVSALGFGGYRISSGDSTHEAALRQALRRGVNLFDTSSNYTDGSSESLIGSVLEKYGDDPEALRRGAVVVSKVGYMQGGNLEAAQRARKENGGYAEIVEYQPSCWHCIHPEFLADQLRQSLARLGMDSLDVYLLHNPEYFLSDAAKRQPSGDLAETREIFYRRIGQAFRYLEQCVEEGSIRWYGVSSNTFGAAPGQKDFVSLEWLIDLGRQAAAEVRGRESDSAFAVVQCPLNLYEAGPLLTANQADGATTFLQLARQAELGVLVNRPLNAIRDGRLMRLVDFPVPRPNVEQEIELALDALQTEEVAFAALFRPAIAAALPEDAEPHAPFGWSVHARQALDTFTDGASWSQALTSQVYPQLQQAGGFVQRNLPAGRARKSFAKWYPAYCRKLETAAGMIGEWLGREDFARSAALHERLAEKLAAHLGGLPLSQKALLTLLALPQVACVLNGMRRASYVEDSTAAMAAPQWPQELAERILGEFAP